MASSNRPLVVAALRCYPRRWRARHGTEAWELAELLTADGVPEWSIAASYLGGAVQERLVAGKRRAWRAVTVAVLALAPVAGAAGLVVLYGPTPAGAAGVSHQDRHGALCARARPPAGPTSTTTGKVRLARDC